MKQTLESKRCGRCGETKPLTAFYVDHNNKTDGRQGHCKDCRTDYNRERR